MLASEKRIDISKTIFSETETPKAIEQLYENRAVRSLGALFGAKIIREDESKNDGQAAYFCQTLGSTPKIGKLP